MTLTLKFGRKKIKKFLPGVMKNIEGYINFQNYMWQMINESMKKYQKKNTIEYRIDPYKEDVFNVNLYKEDKDFDEDYKMEWLVCDITGCNKAAELKEFGELDKFESTLKDNFEKNKKNYVINKPNNLLNSLTKTLIKTKESIIEVIEKGIEHDRDKSISQFLLDLDIIIVKLPPKENV